MRLNLLLCALCVLIARTTCAEIVPIPTNAPAYLEPPRTQAKRDPLGFSLMIQVIKVQNCLVFYLSRYASDPYDTHLFVLQRSNTAYNNGAWENISWRESSLPYDKAEAMFADRIDRDEPAETGVVRYRVLDTGSVQ